MSAAGPSPGTRRFGTARHAFGLLFALAVGLINGVLIADVEIPALYASWAWPRWSTASSVTPWRPLYVASNPPAPQRSPGSAADLSWARRRRSYFSRLDRFGWFRVPALHKTGAICLCDRRQFRRRRAFPARRFARSSSCNTTLSAMIAFVAGMITAIAVASMNTNVVNFSLNYNIILVVVLGGIGLPGGARAPQRDCRHAADRHFAQRNTHHEHPIHAPERDPARFSGCDLHR